MKSKPIEEFVKSPDCGWYMLGCLLKLIEKDKLADNIYQPEKNEYKERIDKAFKHLELYSVSNMKMAYRDFFDSLKFIIGNYKLYKSKANIKVGLYYNNDLLNVDEIDDLDELTSYLQNKEIKLYAKLSNENRVKFKIAQKLNKVDLKNSWKQRKTFSLSLNRLKDLETWL